MKSDSIDAALKHHQAGNLDQAEQVYRKILRVDPKHADALHLLGVIGHQRGQGEQAVALIGQAIAVRGSNSLYHSNLGAAHQSLGRHREAIVSFRRAIELNPRYADAQFNLGVAYEALGDTGSAELAYEQTLRLVPEHPESHNNLGNLLKARGKVDEAVAHYRQALQARPRYATARFNLGTILQSRGDLDGAAECYAQAAADQPNYAEALDNLGLIHATRGKFEEAAGCHRKAIEFQPTLPQPWLHLGSACVSLGRFDEAGDAFARCRVLVANRVDIGPVATNLALALVEFARALRNAGEAKRAQRALEQAQDLDPRAAHVLFELGTYHEQSGDLTAAAEFFDRGLALQPFNAIGHNNLGNVRAAQGRQLEAIACYERALSFKPDFPEALYNLGNVQHDLGHSEEAIRRYREAIRQQPGFASVHNNLGKVLQDQYRLEEAAECYRRALEHRADFGLARINLGNVLQTLGRIDEAAECYRLAADIDPRNADVQNNLGVIATLRQQWDEAGGHFQTALALNAHHVGALTNYGTILKSQGRIPEARELLERALHLQPSNKLRVLLATLLPPIYDSGEDLRQWRETFTTAVTALVNDGVTLDPHREALPGNFYLAYQGLNDGELQTQFAKLNPTLDCRALDRPASNKIRIGFLSKFFKAHTIGRFMHGLIAGLNRDEFEVVVCAFGPAQDMLARKIEADADRYVILPESLPAARERLAQEHLDVLFFADLGMDPVTFSLAFTRFAPVQCVTWGHPVTTGIPTVDYFLSSDLVEPYDADAHYSEQLVRLKSLPTVYARPALPDPLRPRSTFGLPEDAHLYLCPQSLFKFHPDFDAVLRGILERDPHGRIVLLEGTWPNWTEALQARFARTLGDTAERVLFISQLNHPDYLNVLAISDVMLDPLHFGGGNSTFEGLAVGLPIVTLPGEFLRGRVTLGCYRRMGVTECVAENVDDYIALAVRLATDSAFATHVRERITSTRRVLFNDTSVLRELEEFFKQALAKHDPLRAVRPAMPETAEAVRSILEEEETLTLEPGVARPERAWTDADSQHATPFQGVPPKPALASILQTHTCPACGHHVAVPFYDGGELPLTTLAWPRSEEEAQGMPRLPHAFVRCVDCGHVSNREFDYANVPYSDKPNLMFNRGQLWTEHLQQVRDLVLERLGPAPVVVEIGCGDGHLLRALARERPAGRYIGFDPSGAIDDGGGLIEARRELFLPERHLGEFRPDLVVSRHVLEHLMNPLGFVQALAFACSWENAETLLLIEVPCIDQVIASGRTVDFFYEHNSHFTTTSLRRLLLRCASEVELVGRSYNDEVVYGLAKFQRRDEQVDFASEAVTFRDRAAQSRQNVRDALDQLAQSGRNVALWGGTGKAAAFINQYGLDAERFPIVVDSDADKAGTFVPGMGQEIRYRDWLLERPSEVIVIATQWRAADIVLEIERCGIQCDTVLLEHHGRLVDFHRENHPYRKAA